jgi:hypothetical protein
MTRTAYGDAASRIARSRGLRRTWTGFPSVNHTADVARLDRTHRHSIAMLHIRHLPAHADYSTVAGDTVRKRGHTRPTVMLSVREREAHALHLPGRLTPDRAMPLQH